MCRLCVCVCRLCVCRLCVCVQAVCVCRLCVCRLCVCVCRLCVCVQAVCVCRLCVCVQAVCVCAGCVCVCSLCVCVQSVRVQSVPWAQPLLRAPFLVQTFPVAPEEVGGEGFSPTKLARGSGGNGRIRLRYWEGRNLDVWA